MRTIRHGTKEFDSVLRKAENICCFSLSNNFVRSPLQEGDSELILPPREWLKKQSEDSSSKLLEIGSGKYRLRIHSNLWYDFNTDADLSKNEKRCSSAEYHLPACGGTC